MGRPYRGAVIPYGETVMLLVPQGVKGKPRFVQGQVLGKVMSSDQWIGCTSAGRLVLARTARRLSAEFPPQDHKVLKGSPAPPSLGAAMAPAAGMAAIRRLRP